MIAKEVQAIVLSAQQEDILPSLSVGRITNPAELLTLSKIVRCWEGKAENILKEQSINPSIKSLLKNCENLCEDISSNLEDMGKGEKPHKDALVCMENKDVQGVLLGSRKEKFKPFYYIDAVVIDPGRILAERRGAGGALMKGAEELAKGLGYEGILLESMSSDVKPFYIKCGFEEKTNNGRPTMKMTKQFAYRPQTGQSPV